MLQKNEKEKETHEEITCVIVKSRRHQLTLFALGGGRALVLTVHDYSFVRTHETHHIWAVTHCVCV